MTNSYFQNEKIRQALAIFAGLALAGTAVAFIDSSLVFAQTTQSQNSTAGSGAAENGTSTAGQGGNTTQLSSTLEPTCLDNMNGTSTSGSANTTSQAPDSAANTSANSSAANMDASNNTTTADTSNGANLTAIGEATGAARMHLLEACTAVQNGDTELGLTHMNLVARALDSITGNLTSASLPTAGTSASSVGNTTAGGSGQNQSSTNSTNPLDQLGEMLGLR